MEALTTHNIEEISSGLSILFCCTVYTVMTFLSRGWLSHDLQEPSFVTSFVHGKDMRASSIIKDPQDSQNLGRLETSDFTIIKMRVSC